MSLTIEFEVFFNSSSLQPQSSTLAEGILFKDFAAVAADVGWEDQFGIGLVCFGEVPVGQGACVVISCYAIPHIDVWFFCF